MGSIKPDFVVLEVEKTYGRGESGGFNGPPSSEIGASVVDAPDVGVEDAPLAVADDEDPLVFLRTVVFFDVFVLARFDARGADDFDDAAF